MMKSQLIPNKEDEYYQKLLNAATCSKKSEKMKTTTLTLGTFVIQDHSGYTAPLKNPQLVAKTQPDPGAAPAVVEPEVSDADVTKFKEKYSQFTGGPKLLSDEKIIHALQVAKKNYKYASYYLNIKQGDINKLKNKFPGKSDEEIKKALMLFNNISGDAEEYLKENQSKRYKRQGYGGGSNSRHRIKNKTLKGKNCKQYKKVNNKNKTNKRH